MTIRGIRLLLLLVLAASTVSLGAVTSPASAAGPYTSLTLRADPDDIVAGGTDHVYGADAGILLGGDVHRVEVHVDGWNLSIVGPGSNGPLLPGQTYTGVPAGVATSSGPALSMWVGGGGYCSETTSSFTIREITSDVGGQLVSFNATFEQHCGTSVAALRGSVAVNSTIAPVTLAPMMRMDLQRSRLKYGDVALVDVNLSADAPSHDVAVYLQPPGQPEFLVTHATVTGNGRNRVQFKPGVSGLVVVRWSGGGTFPDLVASNPVSVSAKLKERLRGGTRKARNTHLVPASRDPVLVAAVLPNHQGDCLGFHVQYFVRGRWKYDSVVKCVRLDKHSAAGVRLRGDSRLIGIPIRMRAEWHGDDFNAKTKGKWQYLRFVGGRTAASRARQHRNLSERVYQLLHSPARRELPAHLHRN